MKSYTYNARHGGVGVNYGKQVCHIYGLRSNYISERIILPGQPNPLEHDDWSIYPDLGHSLDSCPVTFEDDGAILVVNHPRYGNLTFDREGNIDSLMWTYKARATKIAVERTPHTYAKFFDFEQRFESVTDCSRTIY